LAFSRKQTLQPRILDLNATVSSLRDMIERLIGEDITLSTKLAVDIGRVRVDPNQIEQVIINLVVNARDAMPQGGSLVVETGNVDVDEGHAKEGAIVTKGPYVMLAVTDTGSGMDKETMEHLFEPFFTTKDSGRGSGLGLATAYGIVKQSGGYIWACSVPGLGSTFKVYLPRTDETISEESALVSALPQQSQGEKVLLVEDEPVIGAVVKLMLEDLGYETTIVANGDEALSAVEDNALEPDLILTDAIMPGMSGFTLIERLRRQHPRLKVLLMSGYTDEGVARHGELSPATPFIQKPFGLQALASKVREVLDKETSKQ
jgi:CheY-like chemotaxis protein